MFPARIAPLASLLLLAACPAEPPGPGRGGPTRSAPGTADAPQGDQGPMLKPGEEIDVTLKLEVDSKKKGTVTFLGVEKEHIEGSWMQGGQRPSFFWTSPEIDLVGEPTFKAPLPEGLFYLTVVNQDSEPMPGEGDLTSGPVEYSGGGKLTIVVDGHFGERRIGTPGPEGPGAGKGEPPRFVTRAVTVDAPAASRPKGATVLIVLGRGPERPGTPEADREKYAWRSVEFTPESWPHRAELKLPAGMEIRLVLDADGDHEPSPGDPSSAWDSAVLQAPEGEVTAFTLDTPFAADGDERPVDFAAGEPDAPAVPAEGGEPRTLTLSTEVRLPFIRTGRFLVVGIPHAEPFAWPPTAQPTYLWVSPPTKLDWPVKLEAQMPDGLDVVVVLDLDGSGFPDTGDLSSAPLASYKRGAADAPVALELKEVIPVPDVE